jgi:hypothetical protein
MMTRAINPNRAAEILNRAAETCASAHVSRSASRNRSRTATDDEEATARRGLRMLLSLKRAG